MLSRFGGATSRKQGNDWGLVEMHIDPKEGSPEMDYAEHMRTYSMFCKMTLWTVISIAVLMALMGYFLT